ncbi:MAG: RHS repeat protein [Thermoflexaceae bacterium]|nr:RHS repeat protein [Thermoflexaceae bacterium]
MTYGYDAANRLTSVTDWNLATVSYAYDDAGRMTAKTLPAGTGVVSSYAYDDAGRLTGIAHVKDGQTTLASVAYTLDAVGNRTGRVDEQGTHSYQYDGLYRLTSVTYPGPSTTGYTFDPFGNRTSMTNSAGTTTYAYDDADRLTEVQPPSPAPAVGYSWDGNGNLTDRGADTFAWDYEDRMVSATVNSVTSTFAYRGDGLRDSRTTGIATTTFTWDINAGLPVVLDDGNRYLYGAGLEAMLTATATYYYLADGLGSTMAMVDSTGTIEKSYTYDVYGKPTVTGALPNEYDFAAQQTDPTGLQYLRARYMDPETGTFISRELLEATPGWTGNPFGYAGANPARMVDPTGLQPIDSDGCELANDACQVRAGSNDPHWGHFVDMVCKAAREGSDSIAYLCNDLVDALPDFNWGPLLDIRDEVVIRTTRMLMGEYVHNGLVLCSQDEACRDMVDAAFQTNRVHSAEVSLFAKGKPGAGATIWLSSQAWEAYKRRYGH